MVVGGVPEVVRVGVPHEGVKLPTPAICTGGEPAGTPGGKMWVKAKFVN
jgi:hypothetical protein